MDKDRIGVTGCSGGGTLTTYIAALDDRVKAAAPSCYITSWDEQLKGTGPQDAEQQFPHQLVEGLNHSDWIGLAAPMPYLIVSTDQDFFPLEGARKTFQEMKRIYTLYDAAVKIDWFHEPGGHGVPVASREAIATFMKRWLKGDGTPVKDPGYAVEHEEDLNVTPTGQLATSLGGETASTWNIRRFGGIAPQRPVAKDKLRKLAMNLTGYVPGSGPLRVRKISKSQGEGYSIELLTHDSDAGLTIPAALVLPAAGASRGAALILDPRGKSNSLLPEGDAISLAKAGYAVLAIDVAGVGELAVRPADSAPWNLQKAAWLGLMTGRTLTGIRMNDILRGLDALKELGIATDRGVLAVAKGNLGPALLHAAVVDERIGPVIVEESLVSFQAVAAAPIHHNLEDVIVPGVLGQYDLPDLAAALAPRKVVLMNLRAPTGRLLLRKEAREAYSAVSGANIQIGLRKEGEPWQESYRQSF